MEIKHNLKEKQKIFSVIIPAYNAEPTLRKTVASAIYQSLGNEFYEILIIDDGSTDNTYALMTALKEETDNIRIFKNEKNFGLGATRNRGIDEARGVYLTFLDADDLLRSDTLEVYRELVISQHPEIVYATIQRVNEYGDTLSTKSNRHEMKDLKRRTLASSRSLSFCSVGAVYFKKFLDTEKIRFSESRFYEDIEFSVRCVLQASRVRGIDAVLYYWVVNPGSITTTMSKKKIEDAVIAFETIHRILEERDEVELYYNEWKKSLFQFLKFTARRVNFLAEGDRALMDHFLDRIRMSEIIQKYGLVPDLLAEIIKTRDDRRPAIEYWRKEEVISNFAKAAAGAVVMVADIDGHVRNFVAIARRLQALGVKCLVCDVSASKGLHGRCVSPEEAASFSDVPYFAFDRALIYPLFYNARAYVSALDWGGFFRPLLFDLKCRKIPIIAFYEGINDDMLLEKEGGKKVFPYRHADHLLLPGPYYEDIYKKQQTTVVGLPSVKEFWDEPVEFPKTPRAVINVNFSYGVLEYRRDEFLTTAVKALDELGISYVISQHPADKADLSAYPVSKQSVYQDTRQGSFLISRFSTCILEALALGKPVVYHNPHGERYPKFQEDSMGAFEVSFSKDDLVEAIKKILAEIKGGVDFRKKAAGYLDFHTNILAARPPEYDAAVTIKKVIEGDQDNFYSRLLHFAAQSPAKQMTPQATLNPARSIKAAAQPTLDISSSNIKLLDSYRNSPWRKKFFVLLLLDRPTLKKHLLKTRTKSLASFMIKLIPD